MPAPVYHSADTTTHVDSTNSGSITLTYPANIAAGDLLLLFAKFGSIAGNNTVPAGWTQLYRVIPTLGAAHQVIYKIAAGTETGTFTWTLTSGYRSLVTIIRVSGLLNKTISDVIHTGVSLSLDPGAVDASAWSADDVLYIANVSAQNTDYTFSPPTNYSTDAFNVVHDPTNNNLAFVRMAFGFWSGVGANEDPDTWTYSGGSTPEYPVTSMLAIRGDAVANRWGFTITNIKEPNEADQLVTGVTNARVKVWLDGTDTGGETYLFTNQSITDGALNDIELSGVDEEDTPVVEVMWTVGTERKLFITSTPVIDLEAEA